MKREALVKGLLAILAVLLLISVLTGLERERVFAKEREAAETADRDVWMMQGERNPHSAAHFSRYAFRPQAPLALLDPGTSDFAGMAVWLEAHFQDPAAFRRAEDGSDLNRFAPLTPAFILLYGASLLIFLMMFASIAGEREDGTLRQLLASGVGSRSFFAGKLAAGLRLTLGTLVLGFVGLAAFTLFTSPAELGPDALARLFLLLLVYSAYAICCIAIAIAVSACFRTRQGAFLALTAIWVGMTVLAPHLAIDWSLRTHPQPDPRTVTTQLRAASDAYYADKDRQKQIEQEVLDRYGVATIEELPINYGAYSLQVSEELSFPEFDRVYAELDQIHSRQESVVRRFSFFSPAIATANLSRALAGTDRLAQGAFTSSAEMHRREMIRLLNEDYMYNAKNDGSIYKADAELWSQFTDYVPAPPTLGQTLRAHWVDLLTLLVWLVISASLAYALVVRATRHEVSKT